MIEPSRVRRIQRLLATESLSRRKIAKMVGVSRATVAAIASQQRPDYQALRRARADDALGLAGPVQRCPGCGAMVAMPCRCCHTRARKASSATASILRGMRHLDEPLGVNLRGQQRRRYEEIHARKLRAGDEQAALWPEPAQLDDRQHALDPIQLFDALEPDDDAEPELYDALLRRVQD